MDRLVARFEKNALEDVRVLLKTYKGHDLIDLRVYYLPGEGQEPRPTKKGLCVKADLLPELKKAVLALEEALKSKLNDVLENWKG